MSDVRTTYSWKCFCALGLLAFLQLLPHRTKASQFEAKADDRLPPAVAQLADRLLRLEKADHPTRIRVREWVVKTRSEIKGRHDEPLETPFVEWLKTLKPSGHPDEWRLSQVAQTGRGSCLGLVNGALLVGRSIGLQADPVAVPDHLLLRIVVAGEPRFLELLESAREFSLADARQRYHTSSKDGMAFFRPLSDQELLSCIRIERGAGAFDDKKLRRARADFRAAIRAFPEHPAGHLNLGLVFASQERWEDAEQKFSHAIKSNSLDPRAWYNRALARWKLGRQSGSRADIEAALLLNPRMPEAIGLLRALDEK